MDANTLRTLKIPPRLLGDAQGVCTQVLHPLARAAIRVVLVPTRLDLEVLAQLTCGLAPLVRDGVTCAVVFLCLEEGLSDIVSAASRATRSEALSTTTVLHRLGLFKVFASSEAMRLAVRVISRDDLSRTLLTNTAGVTLL